MKALAAGLLLVASGTVHAQAGPPPAAVEYFPAPAPAPFSTAVRVGNVLYMSGQIGITPDGKLPDTFDGQAKQTMDNIGGVLKAHGLGWGDVFKCTVFLAEMKDWPGFNAVYVPYFPAGRLPARSAVGANGLARGALIELECMANAGPK